jgi:G3E family GTPase
LIYLPVLSGLYISNKHNQKQGLKCAVIVNDMGEINVDAALLQTRSTTLTGGKLSRGGSLIQREEKLVTLQNGCICCTLREDLLEEVAALANSGLYDYLIIESTGISEPMQVSNAMPL